MLRLAENQMELQPLDVAAGGGRREFAGQDDVLRTHLRNIEAYLARLTEDVAEGRAQSVQELRGEIRLLARTISALAEEGAVIGGARPVCGPAVAAGYGGGENSRPIGNRPLAALRTSTSGRALSTPWRSC